MIKVLLIKNIRSIPIQEYDVPSNRRSKQVAEQIEENGWIEPLIVSYDKSGNVYIVEGQHRASALKELGYDKAPVIVIHEKGFGEQSLKESKALMKQGGNVITYRNKFNKKYGFELNESHSLEEIAKLTSLKLSALQDIYNKGIGAYKTNPESVRPIVKSKRTMGNGKS